MQTRSLSSSPLASPTATLPAHSNYDLLRVYAYYRLLLSSLLWVMHDTGVFPEVLGTHGPQLFFYVSMGYTAFNLLTLIMLWRGQFAPKTEHIFGLLFIDIVAITLLMHASGGVDSGLGYLLIICVAAGSIFITGQIGTALAALASLLVIGQSLIDAYTNEQFTNKELFSAGTLGILLFIASLVFQYLTNRITLTAIEAAEQSRQAEHLQKLTDLIVERMRTGIIVVDTDSYIVLCNQAAARLLNYSNADIPGPLSAIPDLEEQLKIWRTYPHNRSPNIHIDSGTREVRINFSRLEPRAAAAAESDTLIFVEDSRRMAQEAQQLKLASLGRLTASIAHEVRNPLGAISHASQLLQESPDIGSGDIRLTEIIQNHSMRVNHIIENVLQLSRRKPAQPEVVNLAEYLGHFVNDFSSNREADIDLQLQSAAIKTKVDPSQLTQVLTNLCENGLRYSHSLTGAYHLQIVAAIDRPSDLPYIEIIDDGGGVDAADMPHIFEPFFTTETTGSGLGLYISKELCEANQASLSYRTTGAGKSCFRIDLTHYQRIF